MVQGKAFEVRKELREVTAFLDIFRRNWGLKVISLILALVIYYSMRDSSGEARAPQHIFTMKGSANGGSGK